MIKELWKSSMLVTADGIGRKEYTTKTDCANRNKKTIN